MRLKELNSATVMIGSIDIKTRPLKLAFLVDSASGKQVRDAIRLASTLWGGSYFPIIQLYKRMPATWRDKPLKAPHAKKVILGYIEAFDPDMLVQFSAALPAYIDETGLRVIKPGEVWDELGESRSFSPKFGLGIFEILREVFDENFKFKAKYPVSVILPRIPSRLSLFWASLFGELPDRHREIVERHYAEALEIQSVDVKSDNLAELLAPKARFPRRLVQHGIATHNRSFRLHTGFVFFLDATKIEDIVDFWNLRALGKPVIAVPKQLINNLQLNEYVIGFVKEHRRHWPHNPKVCDRASFIRARSCSMEEMQSYATSLTIERDPNDPSSDGFLSLQHWYPRIWDEWARDKDGAAPDDLRGDKSESVDIGDTNELRFRIPSVLPSFAQPHGYSDFTVIGSTWRKSFRRPRARTSSVQSRSSALSANGGQDETALSSWSSTSSPVRAAFLPQRRCSSRGSQILGGFPSYHLQGCSRDNCIGRPADTLAYWPTTKCSDS